MARILLLIILIYLIYRIFKRVTADILPKKQLSEEKMVRCAHCGTHVPESETVTKNNRLLCNNPECSKF